MNSLGRYQYEVSWKVHLLLDTLDGLQLKRLDVNAFVLNSAYEVERYVIHYSPWVTDEDVSERK